MRGDVYELPARRKARGHEQQGKRHGVVVQSDLLPLSTWLIAPTSVSARPASFRPIISISGIETHLLVEQTAAVDPQRLGTLIAHLTRAELDAVDDALRIVLSLG
ncbi:MAG: type II toxin-antitoxin system PemK/MazF family toxin [Actinomycetes bacterium]